MMGILPDTPITLHAHCSDRLEHLLPLLPHAVEMVERSYDWPPHKYCKMSVDGVRYVRCSFSIKVVRESGARDVLSTTTTWTPIDMTTINLSLWAGRVPPQPPLAPLPSTSGSSSSSSSSSPAAAASVSAAADNSTSTSSNSNSNTAPRGKSKSGKKKGGKSGGRGPGGGGAALLLGSGSDSDQGDDAGASAGTDASDGRNSGGSSGSSNSSSFDSDPASRFLLFLRDELRVFDPPRPVDVYGDSGSIQSDEGQDPDDCADVWADYDQIDTTEATDGVMDSNNTTADAAGGDSSSGNERADTLEGRAADESAAASPIVSDSARSEVPPASTAKRKKREDPFVYRGSYSNFASSASSSVSVSPSSTPSASAVSPNAQLSSLGLEVPSPPAASSSSSLAASSSAASSLAAAPLPTPTSPLLPPVLSVLRRLYPRTFAEAVPFIIRHATAVGLDFRNEDVDRISKTVRVACVVAEAVCLPGMRVRSFRWRRAVDETERALVKLVSEGNAATLDDNDADRVLGLYYAAGAGAPPSAVEGMVARWTRFELNDAGNDDPHGFLRQQRALHGIAHHEDILASMAACTRYGLETRTRCAKALIETGSFSGAFPSAGSSGGSSAPGLLQVIGGPDDFLALTARLLLLLVPAVRDVRPDLVADCGCDGPPGLIAAAVAAVTGSSSSSAGAAGTGAYFSERTGTDGDSADVSGAGAAALDDIDQLLAEIEGRSAGTPGDAKSGKKGKGKPSGSKQGASATSASSSAQSLSASSSLSAASDAPSAHASGAKAIGISSVAPSALASTAAIAAATAPSATSAAGNSSGSKAPKSGTSRGSSAAAINNSSGMSSSPLVDTSPSSSLSSSSSQLPRPAGRVISEKDAATTDDGGGRFTRVSGGKRARGAASTAAAAAASAPVPAPIPAPAVAPTAASSSDKQQPPSQSLGKRELKEGSFSSTPAPSSSSPALPSTAEKPATSAGTSASVKAEVEPTQPASVVSSYGTTTTVKPLSALKASVSDSNSKASKTKLQSASVAVSDTAASVGEAAASSGSNADNKASEKSSAAPSLQRQHQLGSFSGPVAVFPVAGGAEVSAYLLAAPLLPPSSSLASKAPAAVCVSGFVLRLHDPDSALLPRPHASATASAARAADDDGDDDDDASAEAPAPSAIVATAGAETAPAGSAEGFSPTDTLSSSHPNWPPAPAALQPSSGRVVGRAQGMPLAELPFQEAWMAGGPPAAAAAAARPPNAAFEPPYYGVDPLLPSNLGEEAEQGLGASTAAAAWLSHWARQSALVRIPSPSHPDYLPGGPPAPPKVCNFSLEGAAASVRAYVPGSTHLAALEGVVPSSLAQEWALVLVESPLQAPPRPLPLGKALTFAHGWVPAAALFSSAVPPSVRDGALTADVNGHRYARVRFTMSVVPVQQPQQQQSSSSQLSTGEVPSAPDASSDVASSGGRLFTVQQGFSFCSGADTDFPYQEDSAANVFSFNGLTLAESPIFLRWFPPVDSTKDDVSAPLGERIRRAIARRVAGCWYPAEHLALIPSDTYSRLPRVDDFDRSNVMLSHVHDDNALAARLQNRNEPMPPPAEYHAVRLYIDWPPPPPPCGPWELDREYVFVQGWLPWEMMRAYKWAEARFVKLSIDGGRYVRVSFNVRVYKSEKDGSLAAKTQWSPVDSQAPPLQLTGSLSNGGSKSSNAAVLALLPTQRPWSLASLHELGVFDSEDNEDDDDEESNGDEDEGEGERDERDGGGSAAEAASAARLQAQAATGTATGKPSELRALSSGGVGGTGATSLLTVTSWSTAVSLDEDALAATPLAAVPTSLAQAIRHALHFGNGCAGMQFDGLDAVHKVIRLALTSAECAILPSVRPRSLRYRRAFDDAERTLLRQVLEGSSSTVKLDAEQRVLALGIAATLLPSDADVSVDKLLASRLYGGSFAGLGAVAAAADVHLSNAALAEIDSAMASSGPSAAIHETRRHLMAALQSSSSATVFRYCLDVKQRLVRTLEESGAFTSAMNHGQHPPSASEFVILTSLLLVALFPYAAGPKSAFFDAWADASDAVVPSLFPTLSSPSYGGGPTSISAASGSAPGTPQLRGAAAAAGLGGASFEGLGPSATAATPALSATPVADGGTVSGGLSSQDDIDAILASIESTGSGSGGGGGGGGSKKKTSAAKATAAGSKASNSGSGTSGGKSATGSSAPSSPQAEAPVSATSASAVTAAGAVTLVPASKAGDAAPPQVSAKPAQAVKVADKAPAAGKKGSHPTSDDTPATAAPAAGTSDSAAEFVPVTHKRNVKKGPAAPPASNAASSISSSFSNSATTSSSHASASAPPAASTSSSAPAPAPPGKLGTALAAAASSKAVATSSAAVTSTAAVTTTSTAASAMPSSSGKATPASKAAGGGDTTSGGGKGGDKKKQQPAPAAAAAKGVKQPSAAAAATAAGMDQRSRSSSITVAGTTAPAPAAAAAPAAAPKPSASVATEDDKQPAKPAAPAASTAKASASAPAAAVADATVPATAAANQSAPAAAAAAAAAPIPVKATSAGTTAAPVNSSASSAAAVDNIAAAIRSSGGDPSDPKDVALFTLRTQLATVFSALREYATHVHTKAQAEVQQSRQEAAALRQELSVARAESGAEIARLTSEVSRLTSLLGSGGASSSSSSSSLGLISTTAIAGSTLSANSAPFAPSSGSGSSTAPVGGGAQSLTSPRPTPQGSPPRPTTSSTSSSPAPAATSAGGSRQMTPVRLAPGPATAVAGGPLGPGSSPITASPPPGLSGCNPGSLPGSTPTGTVGSSGGLGPVTSPLGLGPLTSSSLGQGPLTPVLQQQHGSILPALPPGFTLPPAFVPGSGGGVSLLPMPDGGSGSGIDGPSSAVGVGSLLAGSGVAASAGVTTVGSDATLSIGADIIGRPHVITSAAPIAIGGEAAAPSSSSSSSIASSSSSSSSSTSSSSSSLLGAQAGSSAPGPAAAAAAATGSVGSGKPSGAGLDTPCGVCGSFCKRADMRVSLAGSSPMQGRMRFAATSGGGSTPQHSAWSPGASLLAKGGGGGVTPRTPNSIAAAAAAAGGGGILLCEQCWAEDEQLRKVYGHILAFE